MSTVSLRQKLLYALALLLGIGLLGWFFLDIVIYFALSLVLTTLLKPLVNALHRFQFLSKRMPRMVAILLAFSATVGLLWAIFSLFVPLITAQAQIVSSLDYQIILQRIAEPIARIEHFFISLNITEKPPGFLNALIKEHVLSFFESIEIGAILNYFVEITGSIFIALLSVVFISFVLLYEEKALYRSFIAFVPNRYFEMVMSWIFKIEKGFVSYLGGLVIQISIIFTLATVGLLIAGVQYAATIALFAALANLVPYLGPLLGALFAIIVGVSASGLELLSYATLVLVVQISLVFLIVQLMDNLLVQPLVFSRSVKAHPIEIFLIIFVGAILAGIPGMIAAIPVYTILKISINEGYKGLSAYRVLRK